MSLYLRKQIRDELKTLLETLTSVDGRVYYDYMYAIPENKMPCIVVTTGSESIERVSLGRPSILEKNLSVIIHAITTPKTGYQDALDNIGLEIETLIANNITLNNKVKSLIIKGIDLEVDDERDVPVSFLTFNVSVNYRISEEDPSVSI